MSDRLRSLMAGAQTVTPFNGNHSATVPVVVAESIPWTTARDLADETPEVTEFNAWPIAASGALTELVGPVKKGKTTVALDATRAILAGSQWLGVETIKGPVIYATEQGGASFREGLSRAGLLDSDDLHILSWPKVSGVPWPALVAAFVAKAKETGARVVFVDTLSQWSGLRGDSENDAGAAMAAIQPLMEAAALHGLAVVILRHERKAGGEVGESARGSTAFAGAADTIIQLRRSEGGSVPGMRVLNILSRFSGMPEQLVIELTDKGFVAHGNGDQLAINQAIKAITETAPTDENEALTTNDLIEAAGVKRTIGQRALNALAENGTLSRSGTGKRGKPYLFWRPLPDDEGTQKDSATVRDTAVAESNVLPDPASTRSLAEGSTTPSPLPGLAPIHSATAPSPRGAETYSADLDNPFAADFVV